MDHFGPELWRLLLPHLPVLCASGCDYGVRISELTLLCDWLSIEHSIYAAQLTSTNSQHSAELRVATQL